MKSLNEIERKALAATKGEWKIRESPINEDFFIEAPKARSEDLLCSLGRFC